MYTDFNTLYLISSKQIQHSVNKVRIDCLPPVQFAHFFLKESVSIFENDKHTHTSTSKQIMLLAYGRLLKHVDLHCKSHCGFVSLVKNTYPDLCWIPTVICRK